jgi:hypothetical protein
MNNVFVVLSTINSKRGIFTPEERYRQTILTIESIKSRAPNAKIIFLDNSNGEINKCYVDGIQSRVDKFEHYTNDIINYINNNSNDTNTGANELFLMRRAVDLIDIQTTKRIFKLSSRYLLMPEFDINYFNNINLIGRYTFKHTLWWNRLVYADGHEEFFNRIHRDTRFWSMCVSLVPHYCGKLQSMYDYMINNNDNLETAHLKLIEKEYINELTMLHVGGYAAFGQWHIA